MARSLVRKRGLRIEAVFEAYREWRRSNPFDVGRTTFAALARGFSPVATAQADSQANGSMMRASPFGILAAGDPARAAGLAAADSALTHANPVCVAACVSFAAAVAASASAHMNSDNGIVSLA